MKGTIHCIAKNISKISCLEEKTLVNGLMDIEDSVNLRKKTLVVIYQNNCSPILPIFSTIWYILQET